MQIMVVKWRFNKPALFKYKSVTLVVIVILVFLFKKIFEVTYNLVLAPKICEKSIKIDAVYTWVNGSDPKFLHSLQETLKNCPGLMTDVSSQRFDDKYELKFSLRSLEKHAPWIRHVYIVTNGQIPHWLDLDYEKVTLITHDEIFPNKSDLPTFSSPAIETHIHRIPGVSDPFLYLNDDVFLGSATYPEDFVSDGQGFAVYLAWPLPPCATDCPWLYVRDGQCDHACNTPLCQMDGGDCLESSGEIDPKDKSLLRAIRYKSGDRPDNNSHLIGNLTDYKQTALYLNKRNVDVTSGNVSNNTKAPVSLKNKVKVSFVSMRHTNDSRKKQESTPTNGTFVVDGTTGRGSVYNVNKVIGQWVVGSKPGNDLIKALVRGSDVIHDVVQKHNRKMIMLDKLQRRKRKRPHTHMGGSTSENSKKSIDTYSASLQHTNRVFNQAYSFQMRHVPSHAPLLISPAIMEEVQSRLPAHWAATGAARVRRPRDIQPAFAYLHHLIEVRRPVFVGELFREFDTDDSGTWADRELRTLIAKLHPDGPLRYSAVEEIEGLLLDCSEDAGAAPEQATMEGERYADSRLPVITEELVTGCGPFVELLKKHFGWKKKYNTHVIKNAESTHVTFRMLNSNVSDVVNHLDDIRRNPKKFVCLNDNLDESKPSDNDLVRVILYDFYMSLFPHPSKFELPQEYRNRFLHVNELKAWKLYHQKVKLSIFLVLVLICYFMMFNTFVRLLCRLFNKLFY